MMSDEKLESIADIIDSRHKTPTYSDVGYPMVRVVDIKGGYLNLDNTKKVSEDVYKDFSKGRDPEVGDLVFSRVGSYGNVSVVKNTDKFCLGQNTVFIIPKEKDDYLYYALQSPQVKNQIESSVVGAVQKTISLKSIKLLDIPYPEKEDRAGIVKILSNIDSKISNNTAMNATLEKIAQRIFKSWFVDFDPVKANAEGVPFDGLSSEIQALFPNEFEESELGMIPKGWEVKSLEQIGDIITGKTPSTKNQEYYGNEIPFITIPDMHGKSLVTEPSKYLSKKGEQSQPKKTLPKGSILVSCIATPGLVILAHEDCQTNQQINSLLPYDKFSNFYFLSLKSMSGRSAFSHDGTVFDNMNKTSFSNLKMVVPSFDLLKNFNDLIEPIVEKVLINQKQVNTLAKIRDKLLPRLISGKITIQKAEELLEEAS